MVLSILAGCATFARYNYDDRKNLPASTESNLGYAAVDRHFQLNSTIPQYLFIQSPHDLRTPKALADLEQMAQRISQLPGIAMVRGVTRPTGESLEQARATYQAGEVGNKLNDASKLISDKTSDLNLLTNGANTMADNLGNMRGQDSWPCPASVVWSTPAGPVWRRQGAQGDGHRLSSLPACALGDDGVNLTNTADTVGGQPGGDCMTPARPATPTLPAALAGPVAAAGRRAGTLDKITDLARQLQSTQTRRPESTRRVCVEPDTATNAMRSLGLGAWRHGRPPGHHGTRRR
jgi:RND superfamily putative drug exporter